MYCVAITVSQVALPFFSARLRWAALWSASTSLAVATISCLGHEPTVFCPCFSVQCHRHGAWGCCGSAGVLPPAGTACLAAPQCWSMACLSLDRHPVLVGFVGGKRFVLLAAGAWGLDLGIPPSLPSSYHPAHGRMHTRFNMRTWVPVLPRCCRACWWDGRAPWESMKPSTTTSQRT